MSYDKIPHIYEDNRFVDYKNENVNHKFLERNLWYHTHDGNFGSSLEEATVSGTFTTDSLIIKNKVNIEDCIKHWDSGWKNFDPEDGFTKVWPSHPNKHTCYYQKTIKHTLGVLPTLSFLQEEISEKEGNIGTKNSWSNEYRSEHYDLISEFGAQIGDISSTEFTLKIGYQGASPLYTYRILLLV
jgi:hypothetical protein